MKRKMLVTLLCVSLTAGMLVGCGSTGQEAPAAPAEEAPAEEAPAEEAPAEEAAAEEEAPAAETYNIGYCNQQMKEDFFITVESAIYTAAMNKGYEYNLAITDRDSTKMVTSIETLVTKGADIIVDFNCLPEQGAATGEKLAAEGIPMLSIDSDYGEGVYFFGVNNYDAGTQLGKSLEAFVDDRFGGEVDFVVALWDSQAGDVVKMRCEGATDEIQEKYGLSDDQVVWLDSMADDTKTQSMTRDWLDAHPEAEHIVFVGQNDDRGYAINQAVIAADRVARKSTLIKILSGMYTPDSGEIIIDGKSHSALTTKQSLDEGVAVIYQELNYLNDLSIAENILLGQVPVKGPLKRVDYEKMYDSVRSIMDEVGLGHRKPTDMVRILSVAEKQLIEIARAFSHHVKILVMDEPTSALNETETEKLFELIFKIRKKGIGIIYISHRMEELFKVADRVEIMRDGKYVTDRPVSEMTTDDVVAAMVGRQVKEMYPKRDCRIGETVFEVKNLKTGFLKDLSFHVKSGEVVGFFGLMGAGRSETARCLFGAQKPDSMEITMEGRRIENRTPKEALDNGLSYVPAERKTEGCNLVMSVKDNITLSDLKGLTRHRLLNLKYEREVAKKWVEKLKVKTPTLDTPADSLSGGNQQKLVIAKCLNTDPRFLILNEPTRGIDVGAKVEIYDLINDICRDNRAVMMISSELPEIMAMSDRIYVMCEGRITGEVEKKYFTQEKLMKLAIGEVE